MNYLQIKKWRNQISISQAKAAELLGVDLKTYIGWESGGQPISHSVVNACANLNTRYSGTGGQHKALIASIDKYKKAYKVYFGCEPKGKHLVPAEWLTGGFKAVADQIASTTERIGLTKYGTEGDIFDPQIHEALLHDTSPDVTTSTATKILQPGYKFKERILRPARVGVTDPEETPTAE